MKYIIAGTFETNRELSSDELEEIIHSASVQIDEPTHYGSNDNIDVSVTGLKLDISKS